VTVTVVSATVGGVAYTGWDGATGTLTYNGTYWVGSVAGFGVVAGCRLSGTQPQVGIGLGTSAAPTDWANVPGGSPLSCPLYTDPVAGTASTILSVAVSG
jgi:hypothetical protein